MLQEVHPKLPMREKAATRAYYMTQLGFEDIGAADYPDYLILRREGVELHFFSYKDLDPSTNYGQVYIRTSDIQGLHSEMLSRGTAIHPNGALSLKPWGLWEFSVLDPDHNLLTFGQQR